MKRSVGIFLVLVVGIFLFSLNFGSASWTNWVTNQPANNCGGSSESGNCNPFNPANSNGNGYGCDGYTKKGCDDDAGGTRQVCVLEYNSAYCGYVSCTPSNAVCSSASLITCGVTQSNSGSCGGTSCSVTGTSCPSQQQCISNSCVAINQTYWSSTNNTGQKITSAQVGDTVFMVFGGTALSDKNISYEIQHFSGNWIQRLFGLRTWNEFIAIPSSSSRVQNYSNLTEATNYRFNASVNSTAVWNMSENLTISGTTPDDSPSIANIIHPNWSCTNWSVNYNIPFTQNSTDSDDLLKITWNFGDGNSYIVNDYSDKWNVTKADTVHNYSISGEKNVILTANAMTRNNPSTDSVKLQIFKEGINVFPVISNPALGFQANALESIFFNASNTYVVNCTNGTMPLANFTTCDGLLRCSYIHAPGTRIGQNLTEYTLFFNWSLGDGRFCDGNSATNCGGNWSASNNASFFSQVYQFAGRKDINLKVTYNKTS